jgi:hypothetical protein
MEAKSCPNLLVKEFDNKVNIVLQAYSPGIILPKRFAPAVTHNRASVFGGCNLNVIVHVP